MKKKYSAGLVSKRFWFSEFKSYVQLKNEGYDDIDIKRKNDEENIFLANSINRQKEIYLNMKRRVNQLDEAGLKLFTSLDVDNQKIVNFITILFLDELLTEFMLEVYSDHLNRGNLQLTTMDYRSFFTEKSRSSEDIIKWKEYTIKRLIAAYKTNLSEAGLIKKDHDVTQIAPVLLDRRLVQWLVDQQRKDIVIALGGKL
ncbi:MULTISPECIES: DUF1819 family protein [Vagococcus]|uniref:DUF1819 family protein n=1 Tax=Vagococcus TaxID=2737 RepID=UPI000E4B4A55|nr:MULTISPECIES: DUF1819 family protein [Vagococcus]RHH71082.1 DUF1819 family protein [Vagococcus sp. AM17-17]